MCSDIALKAVVDGCYYGFITEGSNQVIIQELPVAYCRTRYNVGNLPAVEFNMKFFDDKFSDSAYRMKVLKLFPEEFQVGYVKYKKNKIKNDGETNSPWYLLTPGSVIKVSPNPFDMPMFVNAIPAIIDLDNAQELDRRKQM